jgi:acyl dehydratase
MAVLSTCDPSPGVSSMPPRVIRGLDELRTLVGQRIGTSDWCEVTQARVNSFAEGTGDFQWIHCDPARASRLSPYGGTIAHGFLTLSLIPALSQQMHSIEGVSMALNYGLNRVRFPGPVPVGSRVRMTSDLLELREMTGAVQATYRHSFEVEGCSKPACVAESVVRLYFSDGSPGP